MDKPKLVDIYNKIVKAQNSLYLKENSVKRLIPTGKVISINNNGKKVVSGGNIVETRYVRDTIDDKSTVYLGNNEFFEEN
jgi:hypothetical protein